MKDHPFVSYSIMLIFDSEPKGIDKGA